METVKRIHSVKSPDPRLRRGDGIDRIFYGLFLRSLDNFEKFVAYGLSHFIVAYDVIRFSKNVELIATIWYTMI